MYLHLIIKQFQTGQQILGVCWQKNCSAFILQYKGNDFLSLLSFRLQHALRRASRERRREQADALPPAAAASFLSAGATADARFCALRCFAHTHARIAF